MTIQTQRFFLRPLRPEDASERYVGWLNADLARRYIVFARQTRNVASVRRYIEARQAREDVWFLGIFLRSNGEHIGNIKFEPVNAETGVAVMGILVGEPDWQGKGVAVEVIESAARVLSGKMGIREIALGVHPDHTAALRAYEKGGFEIGDSALVLPGSDCVCMVRHLNQNRTLERLALGTAQFGQAYGVANRNGQVSPQEVRVILRQARDAGMDTLDTAVAYGSSEEILGGQSIDGWQVITKLPGIPRDCADIGGWVEQSVVDSLRRLRVSRLRGLLLHRPGQLLESSGQDLIRALQSLKENGLVEKVGAAVYAPEEIDALADRFPLDLVQAPLNLLDRRLVDSGCLDRQLAAGVEVHARSVFLQGLLLMKSVDRPRRFVRWKGLWAQWDRWLQEHQLSALQVCLGFALAQRGIRRVVLGVDSAAQLREICQAARSLPTAWPEVGCDDLDLIQPDRWEHA